MMNNIANPECNKAREDFTVSILGYKAENTIVNEGRRVHSIIDNTLVLKLIEHRYGKDLTKSSVSKEYYININTGNMKTIDLIKKV